MKAVYRHVVASSPERALEGVGEAAEIWNAEWVLQGDGGQLGLPVVAGLRYGWLTGHLAAHPAGESDTELLFTVETSHYRLQLTPLIILLISALGGLMVALSPFVGDSFLALGPVGGLMAIGGWFLVVSRLRNATCEDFLEQAGNLVDGASTEEPDAA